MCTQLITCMSILRVAITLGGCLWLLWRSLLTSSPCHGLVRFRSPCCRYHYLVLLLDPSPQSIASPLVQTIVAWLILWRSIIPTIIYRVVIVISVSIACHTASVVIVATCVVVDADSIIVDCVLCATILISKRVIRSQPSLHWLSVAATLRILQLSNVRVER
jgi:hypothetical protein